MNSICLVLVFLIATATSFNCTIPSIYVDIHPRRVSGSQDLSYGSYISAGTPPQNQSLWPSLTDNETALADSSFCTSSPSVNCANSMHGFFYSNQSSTWQNLPNSPDLSSSSTNATVTQVGNDTVHLSQHFFEDNTYPTTITNLTDFPLNILSNYTSNRSPFFGPGGITGLGPSSTLLNQLYNTKQISSRSFGLYLGTNYNRADGAINGSLTLGGYDSARFISPMTNYTLSSISPEAPSALKVHITQISLTNNTATTNLITVSEIADTSFDAYLSTSQYPLTFPQEITQPLSALLNAVSTNTSTDSSLQLPSTTPYNMTITLSTGLTITFPSSFLSNASNISPIDSTPLLPNYNSGNPAILGAAFLAYAYLAVSYDSTPPTFYLAQANLDAPYIQPKTICPNTDLNAAVPGQVPSSDFMARGLVGLVVGVAIGGSALLGLIGVLIWRCRRTDKGRKMMGFLGSEEVGYGGEKRERQARERELVDRKERFGEPIELGEVRKVTDRKKKTQFAVLTDEIGAGSGDLEGGGRRRRDRMKGILKVRIQNSHGR